MSILLSANELSLSFGGKPLFKNLGFVIESGEKIGLIETFQIKILQKKRFYFNDLEHVCVFRQLYIFLRMLLNYRGRHLM